MPSVVTAVNRQVVNERANVLKKVAVAGLAAALLSGCTPTVGTAAVVDGEKISVNTVQESVSQLITQRRATGFSDPGDIANGTQAQDQLRFHIISIVLAKAAAKNGITLTPAEVDDYRNSVIAQVGSEANLIAALTQNTIAGKDFEMYLKDVLYQQRLGEKLVPGNATDPAVASARSSAVNKEMLTLLSSFKITVNPRYGIFDPTNSSLTLKDYTNGALQPRS